MSRSCSNKLLAAEVMRADELLVEARRCSPIGAKVTRADILRSALARGFDVLALELAARVAHPQPFDAGAVALDPGEDPPPSSERRPRRR